MFLAAVRAFGVFCVALAPVVRSTAAAATSWFHAGPANVSIKTAVRALSGLFNVGLDAVPGVADSDVGRKAVGVEH